MNRIQRTAAVIIILGIFSGPGLAQDHTAWTYNAGMYEVNIRQYTKEGTFTAFSSHLDRIRDLGTGILWFMPIHPIGVKKRLGTLGSYYSVKDYYGINPEFGSMQDFKALVDSIHAKGMFVVIDWVANHTSWDNGLTVSHPDWYKKDASGNFIPPPGTNWSDVIQLDHSNKELRTYLIGAMKFWMTTMNVDGFRCDAAGFVPIDFWKEAIDSLKIIKPGLFMLAEDQGVQYYTAGFDMSFGWSFYGFGGGILPKLINGTSNANGFSTLAAGEESLYPGKNYRLYFTSNHDENSWYGTDRELFGNAADAFIALAMTFRGMPLIYGGQEAGLDRRLQFFEKDQITWQTHPRAELIQSLFKLKKKNSALWNGTAGNPAVRISTTGDQNIYAFIRQKGADKILAFFNLSATEKYFSVTGTGFEGTYRNVLTDSISQLAQNYAAALPAWGYKIFENYSVSGTMTDASILPSEYRVQNYPNPFNASTTIRFSLPAPCHVSLTICDLLGRTAAVLVNEEESSGIHEAAWNAQQSPSGIYFLKFEAGFFTEVKKILLMK